MGIIFAVFSPDFQAENHPPEAGKKPSGYPKKPELSYLTQTASKVKRKFVTLCLDPI